MWLAWMGLGMLLVAVVVVLMFLSMIIYNSNIQRPYKGQVRKVGWWR